MTSLFLDDLFAPSPVLALKMQKSTSCATHQARVVIDNVQDPDAPTAGEQIVDEVH